MMFITRGTNVPLKVLKFTLKMWEFINLSPLNNFFVLTYRGGTLFITKGTNVPPKVLKFTLKMWKFINFSPLNNFFVPPNLYIYIYI
jgi:hypothetical protein